MSIAQRGSGVSEFNPSSSFFVCTISELISLENGGFDDIKISGLGLIGVLVSSLALTRFLAGDDLADFLVVDFVLDFSGDFFLGLGLDLVWIWLFFGIFISDDISLIILRSIIVDSISGVLLFTTSLLSKLLFSSEFIESKGLKLINGNPLLISGLSQVSQPITGCIDESGSRDNKN
ncbi:MAG: hypothetical protein RMX96_28415 [Nostoc sp. ChiSLP02]|nr:hypothetical protein [Nostoc sp. DedSLP05]MDZ8188762.1 hypothetical protein [Nostoc sp. ChiSLP02]